LTLTLFVFAGSAAAEEVVLETVTLQPQEKKEVTIESSEKLKLGWDHTDDTTSNKCKNNCVNMIRQDGIEYASLLGGGMRFSSIDGKVVAVFQNIEDFPIEIKIWKEQAP
jgi:hypothetical protein